MNRVKKIGLFLARPDVFFYTLIWLMLLLTVGTVAQKYIGLYAAQQRYFASLVVWAGPVPLPGGLAAMAVIFLGLSAKLVFASPWRWRNSGIIITHIGALLLLLGGMLTVYWSNEGNMVIYEGKTSDFFSDYHRREFVVFDPSTNETIVSFPWDQIKKNRTLKIPGPDISVEVLRTCHNCDVFERTTAAGDVIYEELRGHARDMDMKPIAPAKEDEQNNSGVLFRIKGAGPAYDGIYVSFDSVETSNTMVVNGKTYALALRRARTYLPFQIKLLDFQREYHPGTDMARSFKSEIILLDGDSEWRSVVQMNDPLRYRGYTFYQSSFIDTGKEQATVFAVVKNAGRLFPYISSIVMCMGLLAHMSLHIPRLIKKA